MGGAAGVAGSAARRSGGPLFPRRPWQGRRVVLGVTGGIAAYKAVQLARDLTLSGAAVDVVLSHSARAFVGELSFEALTGRPVRTELVAPGHALDHIRLAKEADLVCVAPATADFLARAAAGRADDLITAILLATRAPVLLCPAMNDAMWAHAATRANVDRCATVLGYAFVGPATGPLAQGEGEGPGRLEETEVILAHIGRALAGESALRGRRVVVTAGPTREPVDPVRVLGNRSSGRMGFAIAEAAWLRGADVVVIAGPVSVPPPPGPALVRVETAEQMRVAVERELTGADVLVMAAAVADFRPAHPAGRKIRKDAAPDSIALERTPDILASTKAARPSGMIAVGFALETGNGTDSARDKLTRKGLDLIVLNDATDPDAGFEVETNRVAFLDASGGEANLPVMSKVEVADRLLDRVAMLLGARS